jgi:hypothetical protein
MKEDDSSHDELPDIEDSSIGEQIDDTMSPSSDIGSATTNDKSCTRDDSPEALVKRENATIRCVKCFAILVLISAALSAAGVIFQYTQGSEQASFRNDFVLISKAITQSLLQDSESYVISAQSIATTITILIEAYNTTQLDFSVPLRRYKELTNEIVKSSYYATWSPLIRSDEERVQFEAMVASREKDGYFDQLTHPLCFVCGDENLAPSTPDAVVVFPGVGQYQCDLLDAGGRNGQISENSCSFVTSLIIENCACKPTKTSKTETTEERSPSEGIFRLRSDENFTIEDEPWHGGPYLPMFLDSVMGSTHQPLLYNSLSYSKLAHAASLMIFSGTPQVTEMIHREEPSFYGKYSTVLRDPDSGPASILYFPVQSPLGTEIAGALTLQLNWGNFLTTPVPRNGKLASVVIESSCGQVHTYKVKSGGVQLEWVGEGDFHDRQYDHMVGETSFQDFAFFRQSSVSQDLNSTQDGACDYRFAGK